MDWLAGTIWPEARYFTYCVRVLIHIRVAEVRDFPCSNVAVGSLFVMGLGVNLLEELGLIVLIATLPWSISRSRPSQGRQLSPDTALSYI